MTQLQQDLASLRLPPGEMVSARRGRWWWVVVIVVLAGLAAGWRWATAAVDVEVVSPVIETSAGTTPGSPILTAAGYVVARRRAVVSAKIQGRLAELHVEEGARVREGEVFARLESAAATVRK